MLAQDVLGLGFCAGSWILCLVLDFVPGLGGTQGPIIALPLSQVLGKDAGQVPLAALHREVLSSSYYMTCTTTHALKTAL